MKIDAKGWRERCHKTREPRPSDVGLWNFGAFEGRLTLSTDGRFDEAVDRFRELLGGRRPQDITVG